MSRKNWVLLAAVATLGVSGFFVARALAAVNPYALTMTTTRITATSTPPPAVRDPARPPARSPFLP
jgi:hypothetical protein